MISLSTNILVRIHITVLNYIMGFYRITISQTIADLDKSSFEVV